MKRRTIKEVDNLPGPISPEADRPLAASLSPRERQLLILGSQGQTDQAIAQNLGIRSTTVGTYWARVRLKLGPLSRTELVAVFLREEFASSLLELKERNSGLLAKLEECSKSSDLLDANLRIVQGLLQTSPDAILVISQTGIIQVANAQAETMFGYQANEMIDLNVDRLIPTRDRNSEVRNPSMYSEGPAQWKMGDRIMTLARKKDDSEFPITTALSAMQSAGGLLTTCVIRDMTRAAPPSF